MQHRGGGGGSVVANHRSGGESSMVVTTLGRGPPCEGAILRGKGAAHCKVWGHSAMSCAKMAEPIEDAIWEDEWDQVA